MSGGTSAVEIGELQEHHLEPLMQIDAAVYPVPWSKRLWKAELGRGGRVYLAAHAEGRLVGYAGALLAVDEAHVTTIAADPEARRRGIGTRLMVELVERCIDLGATALTLEVRVGNEPAVAMYRRFGLAPVGVREGYYEPDGEDALVMWAHDIDQPAYRGRLDAIRRDLTATEAPA